MKLFTWVMLLIALPLLSGCKSELYNKLDETDANQMLALLIYNKIPADKQSDKDGFSLLVEKGRFADAVEVLRQNGLPRRKVLTIDTLFPSGQLVSSPEQEEAKLNYLKSQQLEKMLSNMEGVVSADVSVAEPRAVNGETPQMSSAAVVIKYSPDINLLSREAEIRALVRDAIPGLAPERISLSMQRSEYRYSLSSHDDVRPIPWLAILTTGGVLVLGLTTAVALLFIRKRRIV